MDIGKVVEIGTREVPIWQPAPTMVPVVPDEQKMPAPERIEQESVPA